MNTPPQVTISGQIRKRLAEIEKRMYEGERQSVIVEQLNSEGIKVSLKDFRQLLYRAKKARKRLEDQQKNSVKTEVKTDSKPEPKTVPVSKQKDKQEPVVNSPPKVEPKPAGKMSLADIDNMLKNPLDLDNI